MTAPHQEKAYIVRVVILCHGMPKYLWLSTRRWMGHPGSVSVRLVECNADACHFMLDEAVAHAFTYRHMQAVIEEVA